MGKEAELKIIVRMRDKANKILGRLRKSLRALGKIARIGGLALAGMGLVVGVLAAKMVGLANEQEKVEVKLRTVITSMSRFRASADVLVPALMDTATALQGMGIAGDEAILAGTSLLATYQQISDEELPRAMEVMADISALMGGDMTNAANMLGKAALGMTGELRRAGITIDDATAKTGDFGLMLEAISEQIGAQNEALRRTGYGGMVAMKNAFGDTMEIGGKFIKGILGPLAEAGARSLAKINAQLSDFVDSDRFKEWAKVVIPIVGSAFAVIIRVVGGATKAVIGFLGTMKEIANVYRALAMAVTTYQTDAARKRRDELEEFRQQYDEYMRTGQPVARVWGVDYFAAPFTTEMQAELDAVNLKIEQGAAHFQDLMSACIDADEAISHFGDAYYAVGQTTDRIAEDFMNNVNDIAANIDQFDLLGGGAPAAPGAAGAPADGAAMEAARNSAQAGLDSIVQIYEQAQLEILAATQGQAAAAEESFLRQMETFDQLAQEAVANSLATQAETNMMRQTMQRLHDLNMEEMNCSHWRQILVDQEAKLALMNTSIETFSQGTTNIWSDWIANSVMGIKQGEDAMLKAFGGLIGGLAQQWGDFYVLRGIASIAEAFSTFPAINPGMLAAGLKLVAAGTALKAFGAVMGKGTASSGAAAEGAGGGGGGADALGHRAPESGKDTLIVLDIGEMTEEDIITNVPAFMTKVIEELNDAFGRNVTVMTTGGD